MRYKIRAVVMTLVAFAILVTGYFSVKSQISTSGVNAKPITTKPSYNKGEEKHDYSKPVPKSKEVNESYFDDVVFFGDSLTYGMTSYFPVNSDRIIACKGTTISAMLGDTVLTGKEDLGKVDPINEVKKLEPRKIYIMLGINGLAWMTPQQVIADYEELLSKMMLENPESEIYVQSIFPVSKFKEQTDDRYSNSKIDEINASLLELCGEKNIYFLDTNSLLKNYNNEMDSRYTNVSDGIHINKDGYELWFDYLKTHTV